MSSTNYTTTKKLSEFLQIQKVVVNEIIKDSANGTDTVFFLQNKNVIDGTYKIYINDELTDKYSIDLDIGRITFQNPPEANSKISADYWYCNVSNGHLENVIKRAEDKIDAITNHAWRLRYSGTSSGNATGAEYIYRTIQHISYWGTGIPIDMGHRKIRQLNKNEGDRIEIWVGQWENILEENKEGRDKEFWVDYDKGILYLRKWYFQTANIVHVRLKYRYGESYVPLSIEDLCIKIAARDLILSDDRSLLFPEGTKNVALTEKITILDKDISELFKRYSEVSALIP